MKIRTFALTTLAASMALTTQNTAAEAKGPSVQALLGAVKYDGLQFESSTGAGSKTIDFSTLPQIGGAWSTAPKGERLQFGLECSFLLGFNFESTDYSPTPTTRVYVDYDIWTFDIAGGLYANLFMGRNEAVRLYAAAGPMMMPTLFYSDSYVDNAVLDDSYDRSNESAFGYGLYARTGIEFRIQEYGMLGLGLRGSWLNTDLSNSGTLAGIGAFATYTAGL